jgi:hypothetical protein
VQSEPNISVVTVQSEPETSDLPPLEDGSGPTSPYPQQAQNQPQVPDRLRDLLARTQLHNRVVTGSFSSDELEAAAKFQAALTAKHQLAALLAKNIQLEQAKRQAEAYRDLLASSSSSDSSAYNTPAGSPDSTPILKTKGKIKRNLDQVTNALNFSFARDSRLTRSTLKKKEGEASKILKLNILLIILGLISSINSKSVTYQQTLNKPGFSSSEHQVLFQKVGFYTATVQYLHVVMPIPLAETIDSLVKMSDDIGQYQKDQLKIKSPVSSINGALVKSAQTRITKIVSNI